MSRQSPHCSNVGSSLTSGLVAHDNGQKTFFSHGHSYPAHFGNTFEALRALSPILSGLMGEIPDDARPFSAPAQVEVLRTHQRGHSLRTGLAVFDDRQQLIIHVLSALLGYDGHGPALTRDILALVGAPVEHFQEANVYVERLPEGSNFTIVFTRLTKNGQWTWWSAE